jgi:hypothetical protein
MKYEVIDLDGQVLGVFDVEDQAHEFADKYGDETGRFAYVEEVKESEV